MALLLSPATVLPSLPAAAQEPSQPPPPPASRPEPEPLPPAPAPAPDRRGTEATDPADDPRSVVLLRRDCASTLDREELTLFANGTVRLRQGPPGEEEMDLGELTRDELRNWVDHIRTEDLGETDRRSSSPGGDWVSRCRLELHFDAMERWLGPPSVPGGAGGDGGRGDGNRGDGNRGDGNRGGPARGTAVFEYGTYGSLSLALSRVLGLVDGIAARVDRAVGRGLLPDEYRPRPGDVLRRADGVLFRVERSTALKEGWELQGVQQPLTLYVPESEIPKLFVELVERR